MWCSFVLFSAIYFGFYIVKLLLCFFYPRLHLRGKINKNDISGYDLFFRRYYPNRFSYYMTDLLYSEINNFKKLSRNHKMLRIPFVTGCRFIAVYEKMPYKTCTRTFLLFKTLYTCNTQYTILLKMQYWTRSNHSFWFWLQIPTIKFIYYPHHETQIENSVGTKYLFVYVKYC